MKYNERKKEKKRKEKKRKEIEGNNKTTSTTIIYFRSLFIFLSLSLYRIISDFMMKNHKTNILSKFVPQPPRRNSRRSQYNTARSRHHFTGFCLPYHRDVMEQERILFIWMAQSEL